MTETTSNRPSNWIAGADGVSDGWFVVLWHPATETLCTRLLTDADALFSLPEAPKILGIDMVIGCPDRARPGGRQCDRQARQLLGSPRSASVFSPPAYDALQAESYEEALRRNRASAPDAPGLSKQTYHLLPKMRSLAERMTPAHQKWVREVHPELSFYAMNRNEPARASKHLEPGRSRRLELLRANGFSEVAEAVTSRPASVDPDDVLDAFATCWTAHRIQKGTASRCPPQDQNAPRNDRNMRMEIWR